MKSPKKTTFTIHLIEQDGVISVVAEAFGHSPMPYEIGYEIMASLENAAIVHPHMNLRVEPLTYSERLQ